MKIYKYKDDNDYEQNQRKTSSSKRKINHYPGKSYVEKFSSFSSHFETQFKNITPIKILCVGARNNGEANALRATFPDMELDITMIDIIGTKSRFVKSVRTFLKLDTIEYGNMNDLKFDDETFDFIYSNHSFEHTNKPEQAAKEIRRVTKAGGLIFLCVPKDPTMPKPDTDCVYYENIDEVQALFGLPTIEKTEREPTPENQHHEFRLLMRKGE